MERATFMILTGMATLATWATLNAVAAPSHWDKLERTRTQMLQVQRNLIEGIQNEQSLHQRKKQLKAWLKLQREERTLSLQRLTKIQDAVQALDLRKKELNSRVLAESKRLRESLTRLESGGGIGLDWAQRTWQTEVLRSLSKHSMRDLQAIRADLTDADELEQRMSEEQAQLQFVTQDLAEQESLLKFQQDMQADKLKQSLKKRAEQLEHYRQLKLSEFKLEGLMQQFQARSEFEKLRETERDATRALWVGPFGQMKGRLPSPLGKVSVLRTFGKSFDPASQLTVFKKGVELAAQPTQPVSAIADGRAAFVGDLPRLGRVVVLDHGSSFFSLVGQIGESKVQQGERVRVGQTVALADAQGKAVYFEIRARNVALDPLQWLDLSFMVR